MLAEFLLSTTEYQLDILQKRRKLLRPVGMWKKIGGKGNEEGEKIRKLKIPYNIRI